MSLSSGEMSPADIRAVTGNDGCGDFGNGAWWIIILFLFAFMGNGFGNRGGMINGEPVTEAGLCNAMNFNNLENAVGRLSDLTQSQTMTLGNGISNLGYEMQSNIGTLGKEIALGQANLQKAISDGDYAVARQIADCCCQNRYDALQNANATQRMIDQVNYNLATDTCSINTTNTSNTRDVIDNQNANARAILDKLNEQELNAKQAKIDELTKQIGSLELAQSQTVQNQYLLQALRPTPIPSFQVSQPYYMGVGTTLA